MRSCVTCLLHMASDWLTKLVLGDVSQEASDTMKLARQSGEKVLE